MLLYKTIKKQATVEQTIEKSRFICNIKPVSTKEEADFFIKKIKKDFKDATHNVPAMVLGEKFQVQWASDDGEPQGTSGFPILQMLVNEGITNVVVVVTRYFGGIKLGTGGLVRAYTNTAKLGLEKGGIKEVKAKFVLKIKVDYSYLSKIQNLAEIEKFQVTDIIYEDMVSMELVTDIEKKDSLKLAITDVTAGSRKIVRELEKNT